MATIVRVIAAAPGGKATPHDLRYIVRWSPHTRAGLEYLDVETTDDPAKARRFEGAEAFVEWNTVSRVQPVRPWDRRPNKPLSALTVQMVNVED